MFGFIHELDQHQHHGHLGQDPDRGHQHDRRVRTKANKQSVVRFTSEAAVISKPRPAATQAAPTPAPGLV